MSVNESVLRCKACGVKLERQGMARVLGLSAAAFSLGFAFWLVPLAMGTELRRVSPLLFLLLFVLFAGLFLPVSWLLIVNFCSWKLVEDSESR